MGLCWIAFSQCKEAMKKTDKEQKTPAEIQDSLFILVGRLAADTKNYCIKLIQRKI
jgi:hypothetical protein